MVAPDTQAIIDAVTKLGAERDTLKGGSSGSAGAKLLVTEDFAGGKVTSPHLVHYTSTPQAYTGTILPFVTYAGKSCGHYYPQKGTNEKTPWEVMLNADKVSGLTGQETFDEFCIEWQEHFVSGYPWATAGQKMFRVGYNNSQHPDATKSFDLACLDTGGNLQTAAYWKTGEWFQNSGQRHPMGVWTTWRVWMKLNTSGQRDGFVRVSKNGAKFLGAESLKLREDNDSLGYHYWWIGGNYSQAGGVGTLSSNGHRYITGIRWWDTSPDAAK